MANHATFDTIFIAVGLVTNQTGAVTNLSSTVTAFERGVTSVKNNTAP